MTDLRSNEVPARRVSRRHLLAAGGAGVAALWLGPGWSVLDGVAEAATLKPELRRSTWLQVVDPALQATATGRTVPLRLVEVADLPIAALLPAMRDHDGAFALRFSGPGGLAQGSYALQHADLGRFELFLVPVDGDGAAQTYEAIVDRTVRIAGINEEGVPDPVRVPDARAEQPERMTSADVGGPAPTKAGAVRARNPRLRRAVLSRGASRHAIVVDLALADAGTVATVHGLLLAHGRLVARTTVGVRTPQQLRMRFLGRHALARGRYELLLTVVDRDGRVTRIRRKVRFS